MLELVSRATRFNHFRVARDATLADRRFADEPVKCKHSRSRSTGLGMRWPRNYVRVVQYDKIDLIKASNVYKVPL